MNPNALRAVMHLAALAVSAALFLFLPFSPLVNGLIALAYWIVDGAVTEWVYNRRATAEDKARDLRGRVDNPPS
jgi:hypothetical protein